MKRATKLIAKIMIMAACYGLSTTVYANLRDRVMPEYAKFNTTCFDYSKDSNSIITKSIMTIKGPCYKEKLKASWCQIDQQPKATPPYPILKTSPQYDCAYDPDTKTSAGYWHYTYCIKGETADMAVYICRKKEKDT